MQNYDYIFPYFKNAILFIYIQLVKNCLLLAS